MCLACVKTKFLLLQLYYFLYWRIQSHCLCNEHYAKHNQETRPVSFSLPLNELDKYLLLDTNSHCLFSPRSPAKNVQLCASGVRTEPATPTEESAVVPSEHHAECLEGVSVRMLLEICFWNLLWSYWGGLSGFFSDLFSREIHWREVAWSDPWVWYGCFHSVIAVSLCFAFAWGVAYVPLSSFYLD